MIRFKYNQKNAREQNSVAALRIFLTGRRFIYPWSTPLLNKSILLGVNYKPNPMDQNTDYQDPLLSTPKLQRRRKLLPWWVMAFTWLFIVTSAIIPIGIIIGLLGYDFSLSLLGLSTTQPFSLIGAVVMLLFLIKGITGLALWTEKTWAVRLAKVDAVISIAICLGVMAYAIFENQSFSFRLELIVLFFYYFKMTKVQYDWENFDEEEPIVQDVPRVS